MMKADISFQKELFKAADKLRGVVSPSEYKYYVLPLIFLRFLSIKSDRRKSDLIRIFGDLDLDKKDNKKLFDDYISNEHEYSRANVLFVPESCSWNHLSNEIFSCNADAGKTIDNIFEDLKKCNKTLVSIEIPQYQQSGLPNSTIKELISLFSGDLFSEDIFENVDFLGRTYEYFISNFATSEGTRGGEFFTPSTVVTLLVDMLDIQDGIVFDPACGTGGMFIQSSRYSGSNNIFVGQEQNPRTIALAQMNSLLHNISPTIIQGDSLLDDKYIDLKADYIISNPPFNLKEWGGDRLSESDPRLLGKINKSNANYMWIQHFYYHLKENGKAGFVIANGALTSGVQSDKEIRRKLTDIGSVSCVVQLPDKMFFSTAIPSALIFLCKNNSNEKKNNEHAYTLFIDASKMGTLISKRQRVLTSTEIEKIVKLYRTFSEGNYYDCNLQGVSKVVTAREIKDNDYKFLPSAYIDIKNNSYDSEKNANDLNSIRQSIVELFNESLTIQNKIIELWNEVKK